MKKPLLYKLWNKRTLYEIYFRPLTDRSVEVITFFSGEPFVNPRSKRKDNNGNTEVWDVEDAIQNWDAWVNHGGYEVSEVEDYLQGGRVNSNGESINYRKGTSSKRAEQRVKKVMTEYDKMMRMIKE